MKQNIEKLRTFLQWFTDNFGEEEYLTTPEDPDGTLREVWVPYTELPEYTEAENALREIANSLA
jgi:hypothetical protein